MRKLRILALSAGLALAIAGAARATTIYGYLVANDPLYGLGTNAVVFTPLSVPRTNAVTNVVIGTRISAPIFNGTFKVALAQGSYGVEFGPPNASNWITVPISGNYNIASLLTNGSGTTPTSGWATNTDGLPQGSTNLYWAASRVDTWAQNATNANAANNIVAGTTLNGANGSLLTNLNVNTATGTLPLGSLPNGTLTNNNASAVTFGKALGVNTNATTRPLEVYLGTVSDTTNTVRISGIWNNSAKTMDALVVDMTDTSSPWNGTLQSWNVGGAQKGYFVKDGRLFLSGISSIGGYLTLQGNSGTQGFIMNNGQDQQSGNLVNVTAKVNPTSGSASWGAMVFTPIIQQSNTANGITIGIQMNPSLQSAPDWRSIELDNTTGHGIYQSSDKATNYLGGLTKFGTNAGAMFDKDGFLVLKAIAAGPAWSVSVSSNNFVYWTSNSIPPTSYKSYFNATSNRVDATY